MGISRQSERLWHLRLAEASGVTLDEDLHTYLSALTRRFDGERGKKTFAPGATVDDYNGQEFSALNLGVYVGQTRLARFLLTPSVIRHAGNLNEEPESPLDAISIDRIHIRIMYHGSGRISVEGFETALRSGSGQYTYSRLPHVVTYEQLSDVLVVSIPISRMPDLAGTFRERPAALLSAGDIEAGMYAFLCTMLFRRLTGEPEQMAPEADAEKVVLSIVRGALIPLLRGEETSLDPEIRRIVDSEIEAHHRDPALTVDSLAAFAGMSRRQLYRVAGGGIASALDQRRSRTAREIIEADPGMPLSEVAELSGFKNATRLRDNFVRTYDVLPSVFRTQVKNDEHIDNTY